MIWPCSRCLKVDPKDFVSLYKNFSPIFDFYQDKIKLIKDISDKMKFVKNQQDLKTEKVYHEYDSVRNNIKIPVVLQGEITNEYKSLICETEHFSTLKNMLLFEGSSEQTFKDITRRFPIQYNGKSYQLESRQLKVLSEKESLLQEFFSQFFNKAQDTQDFNEKAIKFLKEQCSQSHLLAFVCYTTAPLSNTYSSAKEVYFFSLQPNEKERTLEIQIFSKDFLDPVHGKKDDVLEGKVNLKIYFPEDKNGPIVQDLTLNLEINDLAFLKANYPSVYKGYVQKKLQDWKDPAYEEYLQKRWEDLKDYSSEEYKCYPKEFTEKKRIIQYELAQFKKYKLKFEKYENQTKKYGHVDEIKLNFIRTKSASDKELEAALYDYLNLKKLLEENPLWDKKYTEFRDLMKIQAILANRCLEKKSKKMAERSQELFKKYAIVLNPNAYSPTEINEAYEFLDKNLEKTKKDIDKLEKFIKSNPELVESSVASAHSQTYNDIHRLDAEYAILKDYKKYIDLYGQDSDRKKYKDLSRFMQKDEVSKQILKLNWLLLDENYNASYRTINKLDKLANELEHKLTDSVARDTIYKVLGLENFDWKAMRDLKQQLDQHIQFLQGKSKSSPINEKLFKHLLAEGQIKKAESQAKQLLEDASKLRKEGNQAWWLSWIPVIGTPYVGLYAKKNQEADEFEALSNQLSLNIRSAKEWNQKKEIVTLNPDPEDVRGIENKDQRKQGFYYDKTRPYINEEKLREILAWETDVTEDDFVNAIIKNENNEDLDESNVLEDKKNNYMNDIINRVEEADKLLEKTGNFGLENKILVNHNITGIDSGYTTHLGK